MKTLVIGRIEKGQLQVLLQVCNRCGKYKNLSSFTDNYIICDDCLKTSEEETND